MNSQHENVVKLPADSDQAAKEAGLRFVTDQSPGIQRRRHGKGFGYVDADSKPVRDPAILKRIRSLVIPPAWQNVWICPFVNGHIQAIGRDAKGRKQYRYHPRYREVRDETKFIRMKAFGAALPKIRSQVHRDLALEDLPKQKVVAAIVALMDETCVRIGNEEYARENGSYGLTTLRNRHAEVRGDRLRLQFRGKSKQDHDIVLHDRKLAKIVKKCQDLPGQELFQYQAEDGEPIKIDSTDVNDYLREISNDEFSAKDFRTWHGTGHAARSLVALSPAESATAIKKNIVEAIKETAKKLGNRPAACRKYYVHPALLECYAEQDLFLDLKNVRDSVRPVTGLSPFEKAVLRLVQAFERSRAHVKTKAG